MKRIVLLVAALILISSLVFGASLNLKATWDPNIEPDVAGYNLYRTDGLRVKINSVLIPHPPVLPYSFLITIPDNTQGVASFVLTAVDTAGNESFDSNTATYPFDLSPPAAPAGVRVTK
jgi:hypothetical protein